MNGLYSDILTSIKFIHSFTIYSICRSEEKKLEIKEETIVKKEEVKEETIVKKEEYEYYEDFKDAIKQENDEGFTEESNHVSKKIKLSDVNDNPKSC